MPDRETPTRVLWATISALAVTVMALIGFSVSQVTARITMLEADVQSQAVINRDREARLARLESIVPEIKIQLNRMEMKIDAHMLAK